MTDEQVCLDKHRPVCQRYEAFPKPLVFIERLQNFRYKDSQTLLVYDTHKSHLLIEALNADEENSVTILTNQLHCSYKLQPLDVGVNKPLKEHYEREADRWHMRNQGSP